MMKEDPESQIGGLPSMTAGVTQSLIQTCLNAKILCEHHNSALSPLDTVGKYFFKSMWRNRHVDTHAAGPPGDTYMFNGPEFERWILKVFCGLLVSGKLTTTDGQIIRGTPSNEWLNILFGRAPFPHRGGLYYLQQGTREVAGGHFAFSPVGYPEPYALIAGLVGFPLLLSMVTPPSEVAGTVLEGSAYRPSEIRIEDRVSAVVRFTEFGGPTLTVKMAS
jgi:hypothetical protein